MDWMSSKKQSGRVSKGCLKLPLLLLHNRREDENTHLPHLWLFPKAFSEELLTESLRSRGAAGDNDTADDVIQDIHGGAAHIEEPVNTQDKTNPL